MALWVSLVYHEMLPVPLIVGGAGQASTNCHEPAKHSLWQCLLLIFFHC